MKRLIYIMVGITILLTTFSGCGLNSFNYSESTGIDVTTPKTILMVLAGQSTSDAGIEEMINDVLGLNYPDIELEWECVDWGTKFASQMTAKFAAGDIPDIMIGKAQDVATYVPSGNLAPFSKTLTSYVLEQSLPAVTVNGQVYGLPYNAVYQGVLYNKDIFKEYGIEVPTNQTELKEVVDKLKMHNITPYASHFQEIWYIGNITMQFAMNEVFNKYPNWGDMFRNNTVSFNSSSEFRNCVMYNKDIFNATWDDAMTINQTECDKRFANGGGAMYVTGSWSIQTIQEINPNMNVGIFPFPNQSGDSKLIFEPNITFMKSSKTDYNDAVDKVLELIFSNKNLAVEIFNFTQTASLLKDVGPIYPSLIQSDIEQYAKNGMVTDVTTGNTQLIWTFQEDYSKQIYFWLQGKTEIEDVLEYADQNRHNSISNYNE